MTHARVVSVNVGMPVDAAWAGRLRRTAIDKRPVAGPVAVGPSGLAGDQVADTRFHGGPDKAVYAYQVEDLQEWARRLGMPVPPGRFGENLTTRGIDLNAAVVGERWRIGTALLEVREPRVPCGVFRSWLGVCGYDSTGWVRRFAAEARPGPYLRVRQPGTVRAGDPIVVEQRPPDDAAAPSIAQALRRLMPVGSGADAAADSG